MTMLSSSATMLCSGLNQNPEALITQGLLRQVGAGFLVTTPAGREALRQLDPTRTTWVDTLKHTRTSDPTTTNPTQTSDPNNKLTTPEKALYLDLVLTDNAIQDLIDMGYLKEDKEGRLHPNKEFLHHE